MTIKDELLKLKNSDGFLNPSEVVAWAKNHPASEIYGSLLWDDKKAGYLYRVEQVRGLIQTHLVNVTGQRETVSLTIDRSADTGYRDLKDVLPVPTLRQVLLADALNELERMHKKYEHLQELVTVWEATAQVRKQYTDAHKEKEKEDASAEQKGQSRVNPASAGNARRT